MSLRLKIHLIVGVLVTLFLAALIALQLDNLRDSVREEAVAANRVATQLLNRTVYLQESKGTPALVTFLQGVGRIRANEIHLYDRQGREIYHSPPSLYKAGRDAPAWFARLIQPPVTVQSIDFPDGRLVLQSDASRAALDAWEQFSQMGLTALALFVVVNVVVYWVVGRTVKPFGQIVAGRGVVVGN